MRTRLALGVVLTAGFWCRVGMADKLTVDPNLPGASARDESTAAPKADPRLQQLVAYEGGYRRLSEVAEDLTRLTGVRIRAGRSNSDWRVRDVPLVVYTRDLPLGRLLQAIADCAHVKLAAQTTVINVPGNSKDQESSSAPKYRFYRDKAAEDAIYDPLEARAQANHALAEWAWDSLVACSSMPEKPIDLPKPKYEFARYDVEQIRLVGAILASLGTEGRSRALAGEQITVRVGTSPQGPLLRKLINYVRAKPGFGIMAMSVNSREPPPEPTEQEIADCLLAVKISRRDKVDASAGFSFLLHGIPVIMDWDEKRRRMKDTWTAQPVVLAKALAAVKELNIPHPPEIESVFEQEQQFAAAGFRPIKTKEAWEIPLLRSRITLEQPGATERPTRAQITVELAAPAGWSIICEDFHSHRLTHHGETNVMSGSEVAAGYALRSVWRRYHTDLLRFFVDEERKLVVAWDQDWRERHKNLVSEALLSGIRKKREGEGAELDDVVPLVGLTRGQMSEWITESDEWRGLDVDISGNRELWVFYGTLSGEDKQLARSDRGLPLAEFDCVQLSKFFLLAQRDSEEGIIHWSVPDDDPVLQRRKSILADPEVIASLTMRVRSEPLDSWEVRVLDQENFINCEIFRPGPDGPHKHTYVIELEGQKDNEPVQLRSRWHGTPFPLYTLEREEELRSRRQNKPVEEGKP